MMLPIDVTARSYHRPVQLQNPAPNNPEALPADVPPPSLTKMEVIEAALSLKDQNPAAREIARGDLRTFVENAEKAGATDNPRTFVPPTLRI